MAATDGGFEVTHDSLSQATKVLPDNVSALGDTRGTLVSRTVPASAFGDVEASADAGAAHTETVAAKADQLTRSAGRLDDIIQNIGQTNDRTAQLDEQQARDQQGQNVQLAQAAGETANDGGYRASATIINDGKDIRITPRDPSWPPFTIPNTVGAKQGFSMQDSSWDLRDPGHSYNVTTRSTIPFADGHDIANQELINNPTPGPDQPATPQGTRNNALDIIPGTGGVADGYVNSYVVPSLDPSKYTDTVVNYTYQEHWLDPGFVLRRGELADDGTLTLHTYGEGAGLLQHNLLSPGWRPVNWGVWETNQLQILNSVHQRMGR